MNEIELINKLFYTASICTLVSVVMIKYTDPAPARLALFEALFLLISSAATVILFIAKVWA